MIKLIVDIRTTQSQPLDAYGLDKTPTTTTKSPYQLKANPFDTPSTSQRLPTNSK